MSVVTTVKSQMRLSLLRAAVFAMTAVAFVTAGIVDAEARAGKGGSAGSRGSNTYSAPPATNTAPGAAPMQKSMTQPGAAQAKPAAAATAASAAAQAAKPSMFRNLLLGGLIGAGLATMFGAGAFANILGFLLQGALIAGIVFLVISLIRRRSNPTLATAAAAPTQAAQQQNVAAMRQAMAAGGSSAALNVTGDDFNAFERLLGDIQGAYGRGDLNALGDRSTPEMLSYFAAELDANNKQGVRNELGAPKLLQGDLSEGWREAGSEYATVAMRFAMTDATVDIASGRVVSGSRTAPTEATEFWTFRRNPGAGPQGWELSAIQQSV